MTRESIRTDLQSLWMRKRPTVVFVTHSIEEAVLVGSRVVVLSPHPGQVCAEINVDHLGGPNSSGEDFQAACRRIHDLLFPSAGEA
jgi:NitT/TauT family transport system ATP-binding protein